MKDLMEQEHAQEPDAKWQAERRKPLGAPPHRYHTDLATPLKRGGAHHHPNSSSPKKPQTRVHAAYFYRCSAANQRNGV